jgi:hypothetical protein
MYLTILFRTQDSLSLAVHNQGEEEDPKPQPQPQPGDPGTCRVLFVMNLKADTIPGYGRQRPQQGEGEGTSLHPRDSGTTTTLRT